MAATVCTVTNTSDARIAPQLRLAKGTIALNTGDYSTGGVPCPLTSLSPHAKSAVDVVFDDIVLGNVLYRNRYDDANEKVIVEKLVWNIGDAASGTANLLSDGAAESVITVNDESGVATVAIDQLEYANGVAMVGSFTAVPYKAITRSKW